jgi:uncharacterized alpha-E superfamily protein
MERAELIARAMEVVLDRTTGLVAAEVAEPWVINGLEMLARISGVSVDASSPSRAGDTFTAAVDALARQLGSFLAEASSVREFFSVTAGRMLARLADSRGQLRQFVPDDPQQFEVARIDGRQLESILVDLASLVGLWNESVVHGPAWRFGEVGRRLERAFGVVDGLRGAFAFGASAVPAPAPLVEVAGLISEDHRLDFQRQRVVEIVLASNESLVAYRRRHRSDVEFEAAAHLLVADVHNPRAVAAAVRQVRHQADRLGWATGLETTSGLLARLDEARFDSVERAAAVLDDVFDSCDLLARDVVGSYLSSPVDPRMMGRG